MNKWLIVHDSEAYNDNPRMLGFRDTTHHIKEIEPGDIIVYYLSGDSAIQGIYEVCKKPWGKVKHWGSPNQIQIKPIIELDLPCNFKDLINNRSLDIFKNVKKWYTAFQGTNAIRSLTTKDFETIREYVEQQEKEYNLFLEDDRDFKNESVEVQGQRIKRFQQVVASLKDKYNNCCQIKGCNFTFKKKNGGYYSEGHHIIPLSQGGSQKEENVVILCPNHHRMFHYANVIIDKLSANTRPVTINGNTYFLIYK